jgi:NADPH:quinone reductase
VPTGDVIEVAAAPLNPIDIAIGSGRYYGGHPPLPYVPGCEAVGRERGSGGLVWTFGGGLGTTRNGTIAELAEAGAHRIEVPSGADPVLAAALGIAGLAGWLAVAWRAPVHPGETVLVLGATGTVGLVAVQGARALGAGRIVAAGRDPDGLERAARLGADATVRIEDGVELAAAFRDACGGDGPMLVVDPLWGEPAAAAVEAAAPHARIVNLGQSADATAPLTSAALRGKMLTVLGHTNFAVPAEVLATEYPRLVQLAIEGAISIDVEPVALDDIEAAWQRQADGTGGKLVVVL